MLRSEQPLLDVHLLLGVERHRGERRALVDRNRRVAHAPVVRTCGREDETLDADLAGLGGERLGALHVDSLGEVRIARAGGVAHDRGEMDHRSYVHERVRARSGVSDIPAKHPRTGLLEPLGQLDLAVEQRVEHRDVSSRREQPLAREQADVSGASCDQYSHARGFLRVRAVPA